MRGSAARLALLLALATATMAPTCLNYKNDLAKICDGERLSGIQVTTSGATPLLDWLKLNVGTPEGIVLVNEMSTKGSHDRAIQLRGETRKYGLAACPLADTFDAQAKDEDYRSDVAGLCAGRMLQDTGSVALLDISVAPDDGERMREIREWSRANLKSPDALAIIDRLARIAPRDRGALLRAEGAKAKATPCALADAFDRPLPAPPRPTSPSVVATFSITKYQGDKNYQGTAVDGIRRAADAVNACYAAGLGQNGKLSGKVIKRVTVDATGKATASKDESSTLNDRKVVKCVDDALTGTQFDKAPDKNGGKFTVTMAMTPGASLSAQTMTVAIGK